MSEPGENCTSCKQRELNNTTETSDLRLTLSSEDPQLGDNHLDRWHSPKELEKIKKHLRLRNLWQSSFLLCFSFLLRVDIHPSFVSPAAPESCRAAAGSRRD